jgi:hypothetical protein
MRFASPGRGSFAHGFSRLVVLGPLLSGCGDDPAPERTEPVAPPLEVLAGSHSVLRRGADVSGYCAARKGARTAVATIASDRFEVLTSDSPALEEASFGAAPEVPGFDGSIDCSLVPTATGFASAWVSSGSEGLARVQGLADDGSVVGDTITAGPSSLPRVSLASDGDQVYVGRLASSAEGTEVWVDAIEGGNVTSRRVALCEQPTLPALVASEGTLGVFYACRGAEEVELFGALLGDEEPVTLGTAPAQAGQIALAAVSLEGAWLVQWIPPGTPADALPPLLDIDPETLEATERESAARQPSPGMEPWFVNLIASSEGVFRQLGICTAADAEIQGCHVELCSLSLASGTEQCTMLEQRESPGALLPSGSGATFMYSERAPDFGGDLYTLVLDENLEATGSPSPVVTAGAFAPLGVDCSDTWCTVLGREGQSLLAGADAHRYGFWTTEDVSNANAPVEKKLVLEANGPVLASSVDAANWTAGLAYWDATGLRVGGFGASGPLFTQPVADAGDPAALFFEASDARYRLFERRSDGALASRIVDAGGAGPATSVDAPALQVMCSSADGYLALDPGTRAYYRLRAGEVTGGELLPPIREGSREVWRCVGDALFGLAYNGTGALVYRGLPGATGEVRFETWTFGKPEADGASGGGFGAVAADLADERAAFFVEHAGGFGKPLVAIVLGKQGKPSTYALDVPEEALLIAAAAPALGDPRVLRLVWSDLGSRTATASTWALP